MSANSTLVASLDVLNGKLGELQALAEANHFMVDALRENENALKAMGADETRGMLWAQAKLLFGADEGEDSKPEVLAILDQILAPRSSAKIIPFPTSL